MGRRDPYLVKTVRSSGQARRLQRKGWELTGQSGGALLSATVYTLRLPNPRHRED